MSNSNSAFGQIRYICFEQLIGVVEIHIAHKEIIIEEQKFIISSMKVLQCHPITIISDYTHKFDSSNPYFN